MKTNNNPKPKNLNMNKVFQSKTRIWNPYNSTNLLNPKEQNQVISPPILHNTKHSKPIFRQ